MWPTLLNRINAGLFFAGTMLVPIFGITIIPCHTVFEKAIRVLLKEANNMSGDRITARVAPESLNISSVAADAIFDAMLNPPAPNNTLKQAAQTYMGADKGNGEFSFPLTKQEKA
jgi:hypothetical protein